MGCAGSKPTSSGDAVSGGGATKPQQVKVAIGAKEKRRHAVISEVDENMSTEDVCKLLCEMGKRSKLPLDTASPELAKGDGGNVSAPDDDGGEKWGDLELRRIIGVGAFGRVKLVVHAPTGNTCALKCMRKSQVVANKLQSRVLDEKNILARMEHPFILSLLQTYQDAGELYMLLNTALGGELFSLLFKRAPLPDPSAKFYAASAVCLVSYLHSQKVLYRDLKPENLLLDHTGFLKLVDFGCAKILSAARTFTLCGTPAYLAPEILRNKGHGFGVDWWCVSILSFECLTGTTPFVSNDPMEGFRNAIECRVPWPPTMTTMSRDFIDRLLTVDDASRLGCMDGGSADVRDHPWFCGWSWDNLENKRLPSPYVPKIVSQFDDSNFAMFADDEAKLNYPEEAFPRDAFASFADAWVPSIQPEASGVEVIP